MLSSCLFAVTYARFGLVGAIAADLTSSLPTSLPLTPDISALYFAGSLVCLPVPIGLVVYAFWVSPGGRSSVGEAA